MSRLKLVISSSRRVCSIVKRWTRDESEVILTWRKSQRCDTGVMRMEMILTPPHERNYIRSLRGSFKNLMTRLRIT